VTQETAPMASLARPKPRSGGAMSKRGGMPKKASEPGQDPVISGFGVTASLTRREQAGRAGAETTARAG